MPNQVEMVSKCGRYEVKAMTNVGHYVVDCRSRQMLKELSDEKPVFESIQSLKTNLLNKMNKESAPLFEYHLHITSKYVQIRCKDCKVWSYWLKNKDDIDVQDFYK